LASFTDIMSEIETSGTPVDTGSTSDEEILDTDDLGQDDGDEGDADNADATGDDNSDGFDPNAITDPALRDQLVRLQRQMQAGFTPKLQAAAELQRQFGDLEPQFVDAVRQYQSLLQTNPAGAIDFLAQQQAYLQQQLGLQQEEDDPFAGVEALTPAEEAMLRFAREERQRTKTLERELASYKFQRQQEAGERQFAQIENKYKTQIPLEDKQEVWNFMQKSGISDVEAAWKVLNFDNAAKLGTKRAAETVKNKKKSPPPPTNKQPRTAPGAKPSTAKGLSGHFEEAWNQFSG